jgi:hypothetical protein
MRRVVLHIDRLALHGLAAAEARAVTAALRSELSALLAQPATPLAPLRVEAAPAQRIGAAPTPAALGRAAAGAVAAAIGAGAAGGLR